MQLFAYNIFENRGAQHPQTQIEADREAEKRIRNMQVTAPRVLFETALIFLSAEISHDE